MARAQIEIHTLKLELPFVNSRGDWCQVAEDKIVNTGACVCSGSASMPRGHSLPGAAAESLEASFWYRNLASKGILPCAGSG